MKIMSGISVQLFVFFALLFAPAPQAVRHADAAELRLMSECVSNKLSLHWYGAPGFALQQTTNLAGAVWQEVPGSKGMSFCELPMTNPMAFFRVANIDAFTDLDADMLDDHWETNGWDIIIDAHGYGTDGLVTRKVSCDPSNADTDGDGIEDFWEWLIGTDPRAADTDGDGLTDYEEWFQWYTAPTSVDTDGDARGPNHNLPPKAQLFDGNELSLLRTSPTLDDTDGDGRTDYEEFDQLGRNPLIAEVPKLGVELVDKVDVRLDVEYAEEIGTEHQYGGELTVSDSTRNQYSTESSVDWNVTVGASATVGLTDMSASMSTEVSVGGSVSVGFETETSHSVEQSHSDYITDSRTRTETTASGSMSGGIRLVNTGPITYTITDLGLTVRYLQAGAAAGAKPTFQTLATLIPSLGVNGITLAPGDSTPVLQVSANGLNPSRVKQFLARPNSLYLEPAFYELENAAGLNFDFLEEVTRWRTARVRIDYGNGTNEEYRVATNVERNEDGSCAGVTFGNVMSNILHIPFATTNIQALIPTNASNQRVLSEVRVVKTLSRTNGFWAVVWSGAGTPQASVDFEHIVLQAGDEVLLVYVLDEDGDGLFSAEEQHYRTDPFALSRDSDGDGITDGDEVRQGWNVNVSGRLSYHVFSDPVQADQDGDGLNDAQELAIGTDPTKADTDDDGITDRYDTAFPLVPAKVLRVKWDAALGGNSSTNGDTWVNAFTNLQHALTRAQAGDVAEIWVAAGVYKPTTTTTNRNATFQLVNNTSLYGGFSGVETKLSQRDRDPLSNDTVLSGDLLGNDTSTPWDEPASFTNDNSYTVCTASGSVGAGTVLDGFTITGGSATSYGGGLVAYGRPQLRNLFFRANYGLNGAGLYVWLQTATTDSYVISDCLFLQNGAPSGGGMRISAVNPQLLIVTNCQFYANAATSSGTYDQGGGAMVVNGMCDIENCLFAWNSSVKRGGAITVLRAIQTPTTRVRISRCEFVGNTATSGGAGLYMSDEINNTSDLKVEVLQSVFWGNSTASYGGAIWAAGQSSIKQRLYLLNSTIVSNNAAAGGGALNLDNGVGWIENSILSGNSVRLGAGTTLTVRTTCLAEAASYPGNGNINADPKFLDGFGGNLRLASGSPCIDRGNNYMDYHPTIPGWQPLPDTDLDGNWRITDGNNDGNAKVDMGAYERQE
jgi:hypothetical protein